MKWTTACPDWADRIVARQSLVPCEPLFPSEAEAALEIFRSLIIVDVAGRPTFAEACEPWVFEFVAAIFGAYDANAGRRLITEFMLLISKKNAKSTIAAGIMLTALIRNWRDSAELLILAPTIEAANNVFQPAADMVRADPNLIASEDGGFLHIIPNMRTIKDLRTGSVLKVIAADGKTVVGKKAGFVLVDELWEFGAKAGADAMLREATGGMMSRPEGFFITLSTQSDKKPAGVFKEKLKYARAVRDGTVVDRKFLPILYEFPAPMLKAKAYLDADNFYVTNPNLGKSVDAERLEDELRVELGKGADTRNVFLAKHLNVEIDMGLGADRWAGADYWLKQSDTSITFDDLLERCEVIVPGVDGGGLDDLFGLAMLGRERDTKGWLLWTHGWCHSGVLERRQTIASQLEDFKRAGELTIVDDKLSDLSEIVGYIERVKLAGLLATVAVDPAGLGELVDALDDVGITQDNGLLSGAAQGYAMMNAIKTSERKLVNGTLRHSGSGLADWCVGNLKIEPTATAIRATKQNAGDAKIDIAMAIFDAVTFMTANPMPAAWSPYERRGIRTV